MPIGNFLLGDYARYNPYTFLEMVLPFEMYRQAYENLMSIVDELDTQASAIEGKLDLVKDRNTYNRLKEYANNLRAYAKLIGTKGLDLSTKNAVLDLKHNFAKNILPIGEAISLRDKLHQLDMLALLQDPDHLLNRYAMDYSIDELMENPLTNPYALAYSGKLLLATAKPIMEKYAKALDPTLNVRSIDGIPITKWLLEKAGLTESELELFNRKDPKMLNTIKGRLILKTVEDVFELAGIDKWTNQEEKDKAMRYILGTVPYALGEPKGLAITDLLALARAEHPSSTTPTYTPLPGYSSITSYEFGNPEEVNSIKNKLFTASGTPYIRAFGKNRNLSPVETATLWWDTKDKVLRKSKESDAAYYNRLKNMLGKKFNSKSYKLNVKDENSEEENTIYDWNGLRHDVLLSKLGEKVGYDYSSPASRSITDKDFLTKNELAKLASAGIDFKDDNGNILANVDMLNKGFSFAHQAKYINLEVPDVVKTKIKNNIKKALGSEGKGTLKVAHTTGGNFTESNIKDSERTAITDLLKTNNLDIRPAITPDGRLIILLSSATSNYAPIILADNGDLTDFSKNDLVKSVLSNHAKAYNLWSNNKTLNNLKGLETRLNALVEALSTIMKNYITSSGMTKELLEDALQAKAAETYNTLNELYGGTD